MQLSYIGRIACVALCSIGLLQAVFECVAWVVSMTLSSNLNSQRARFIERLLFVLALTARIGPSLLVLAFLLPAYLRGENNVLTEHVGTACVIAAAIVFVSFSYSSARLLLGMWDMQRCFGMCHEMTRSSDGLPILLYPGGRPLLAVAGVFSSRIIVSQGLLDSSCFPATALDVAFAHERAHVRHHDNLKLLLLRMFPHITVGTSSRPSVEKQWRFFAELAADVEGTEGRWEQSLLLAEMLVAMARGGKHQLPDLYLALFSRKEDLEVRVERLLDPISAMTEGTDSVERRFQERPLAAVILLSSTLVLGAIACTCIHLGHQLAESMLQF